MNNYQSSGYQNKSRSTNLPSSRNKVFVCYNFKQGHLARNCKNRPWLARLTTQANLTEDQLVAMVSDLNIIEKQHVEMISEINYVGGSEGW